MTVDHCSRLLNLQAHHYDPVGEIDGSENWARMGSTATWVHSLSLQDMVPLITERSPQRVLTIGDGRSGQEARFLAERGHKVVASDLDTTRLAKLHEASIIDEYRQLNAEDIDYPTNAFDYTVAKETLHHLQRPYLGIYEMIRVARKAAIFIEPHYRYPSTIGSCLRQIFRRIMRRDGANSLALLPRVNYEDCGNYVYRFNPYELTQCALGMGLSHVAFRYSHQVVDLNCGDLKGEEFEAWKKQKLRKLARRDRLKGSNLSSSTVFRDFQDSAY